MILLVGVFQFSQGEKLPFSYLYLYAGMPLLCFVLHTYHSSPNWRSHRYSHTHLLNAGLSNEILVPRFPLPSICHCSELFNSDSYILGKYLSNLFCFSLCSIYKELLSAISYVILDSGFHQGNPAHFFQFSGSPIWFTYLSPCRNSEFSIAWF